MRSFRFLSSKAEHQKVLVRLVYATLDAFHFFESRTEENVSDNATDEAEDDHTQTLPSEIKVLPRKWVLPEFTKVLVSNIDIVNA